MQKFTRALTREIEIEGERLAVTVDANGVTLRPVGSRRAPLHLSWSGVLCAMSGHLPAGATPNFAEIQQALRSLRGNNTVRGSEPPSPVPPPRFTPVVAASSSPVGIPTLLGRLDSWLQRHRDRYHEALLPSATAEELNGLAQVLGQPVPMELRQWLTWHNGQHEDLLGAFYGAFNLMSTEQIAASWQERQSRHEASWNPAWIPFLDDYQDNLLVLDPRQPGCAVREVWRGREDHPMVASSLQVWLQQFVNDVEAGCYYEDPERGEFHLVRN